MFRFVLKLLVVFAIFTTAKTIERREYWLRFAYESNSSSVVLINDRFPGPMLEAVVNEILVIHVQNNLATHDELTVHFHGLFARKTPQMDGVAYVTQMPIRNGYNFTYVLPAYPSGTYFYHSHSGLQAITAFGALLIHEKEKVWNAVELPDGPLLFSDQWQTSDRIVQENGLQNSPFKWMGEPTGLLINGKRNFSLIVESNRKYLVRLIGATSLSTIVFGIDQHSMTVVEVDGTPVKPMSNLNSIEIMSGQRYAVIIETRNLTVAAFLMKAEIRWRSMPNQSQ